MGFESCKFKEESTYIQTPVVDDQVWNSFLHIIDRLATQIAPKLSTSRYLFPLIVRIGNLGVLSGSSRTISPAILVLEPITVLRSFSSSTQSIESNSAAILV